VLRWSAFAMLTPAWSRTLVAVSLVAGPLAAGFITLALALPSEPEEGVFAAVDKGSAYRLPLFSEGRNQAFSDLAETAVVLPFEGVAAFFVVADGPLPLPPANAVQVYRLVVTNGDPASAPTFVRIPTTVVRMNSRAYRIKLEEKVGGWSGDIVAARQFARALKQTTASRAATDVLIALVLRDAGSGRDRMFAVRFGPE
jgi:hypothetical protein